MKIKMTYSLPELFAGMLYDLPDEQAQAILDADQAIPAEDMEVVEVIKPAPVFIEAEKKSKRKVK
jgi:hypothetical protein